MSNNLYSLFESRFPADRTAPFVETVDGKIYTYHDLEVTSARYANLLRSLGVAKGDRVAVQVEKSAENVFLYLACLRAGAALLPLNTAYQKTELAYFLGDAAPRVFVCQPDRLSEAQAIAGEHEVPHVITLGRRGDGSLAQDTATLADTFETVATDADDLAAILYTSGTTGRSKGAMLSHRNLSSNGITLHRLWGFRESDVLLHVLPIFHTHGLFVGLNCVLLNGSSMLFLERFDIDEVIRLLPRATVFMGVPTFYTRLLAREDFGLPSCRSMRLFISGSAPLLEETFKDFAARTGHEILERYGMTETGMNTSNPLDGRRVAGTVGPPLPGVDVRISDDKGAEIEPGGIGVLEVRGPNVFSGYWQMPEKTKQEFRDDGYFITGDLSRVDADGYIHIVGRSKDLIISGGFNVYPKEVEGFIDAIDGVDESAVIGLAHPDFGEAVAAVVTLRDGADGLGEADIIAQLKDEVARFKVPKRIFLVDELPRNTMGKVQKNVLRQRYESTFANGG
ncbi:MAG: malonyl-CoA synthase [Alphaproteobacteria bacterium]|nr:malonyl-CoA synthase [Alphaproteobacteria bacterium]